MTFKDDLILKLGNIETNTNRNYDAIKIIIKNEKETDSRLDVLETDTAVIKNRQDNMETDIKTIKKTIHIKHKDNNNGPDNNSNKNIIKKIWENSPTPIKIAYVCGAFLVGGILTFLGITSM